MKFKYHSRSFVRVGPATIYIHSTYLGEILVKFLVKFIVFKLYHVIVRPTIIIKELLKRLQNSDFQRNLSVLKIFGIFLGFFHWRILENALLPNFCKLSLILVGLMKNDDLHYIDAYVFLCLTRTKILNVIFYECT